MQVAKLIIDAFRELESMARALTSAAAPSTSVFCNMQTYAGAQKFSRYYRGASLVLRQALQPCRAISYASRATDDGAARTRRR